MSKALLFIPAILAAFVIGCDDDPEIPPIKTEPEQLSVVNCDVPEIECYDSYYTVIVSDLPTSAAGYSLTSTASWVRFTSDKVGSDGIVEFEVYNNPAEDGRRANIVISPSDNLSTPTGYFAIYQKGLKDYTDDSYDPTSDYRLGRGFNAFDEYQSINSVRGQVFDIDLLQKFDSESGFQSVQSAVKTSEDFNIICATSLQEMSYNLTQTTEQSTSLLGYKKTITRFKQVCHEEVNEQFCAYARLQKRLSTRSVDAGAIEYIMDKYHNDPEALPLSSQFRAVYGSLLSSRGAERDLLIKKMLNTFGTHIVIEASLGGMIDYVATFSRSSSATTTETAQWQCRKVLGQASSNYSHNVETLLTSSLSSSGSCNVSGGEATKRKALLASISTLGDLDAIPNETLQGWFSSISNADASTLDVVDFKFIPIWEIFTDDELSKAILSQVIAMQNQSNYAFTDEDLGTDIYEINLSSSDFEFTNQSNANTSLVKIFYVNKTPVLEVCEEYVPKIRTDKRIKVFYPIHSGKVSHAQGLFAGDGEGNRPARLSFYQSDVYVDPIEGYGYRDVLTKAYYMHGNLYDQSFGMPCNTMSNTQIKDDRISIDYGTSVTYPVVKIGDGYWSRTYMGQEMEFGYIDEWDNEFYIDEEVIDNILFANIYGTNSSTFLFASSQTYGTATEPNYGKTTLWYLPLEENREQLTEYLGYNLKVLFKGQASGFEADFAGYFGNHDLDGSLLDYQMRLYEGEMCFIPFKNSVTSNTGKALILSKNYKWETVDTELEDYNYYPVRLFRTSYYIHQSL